MKTELASWCVSEPGERKSSVKKIGFLEGRRDLRALSILLLLDGGYPTDVWNTGDLLADTRKVALPENLPSGHYTLLVGLYSLQTGERLPVVDGQGERVPADAIPLGKVEVQR